MRELPSFNKSPEIPVIIFELKHKKKTKSKHPLSSQLPINHPTPPNPQTHQEHKFTLGRVKRSQRHVH